jgi:leader peptidase (prepilin peptidase)/N-methyltransferase
VDLTLIPPYVFLLPTLLILFALGAAFGSWLNVCIYRIPYEKSIVWPGSRCGKCLRPLKWYHNIPLLSYLLLQGRCGMCGQRFSIRYFLIELLVAVLFPLLFYVEVVSNPRGYELFGETPTFMAVGQVGAAGYVYFAWHAILLSFLIVTVFTDIDHMEIPLSVTLTGTAVGLVGAVLFPWPWPAAAAFDPVAEWSAQHPRGWQPLVPLYPLPVWHPLPDWLPPRSPQLGLATGLAGVLVGTAVPRLIGFLFKAGRGKEGMGLGDADVMMMVGAFLGWQAVIVGFFAAVPMALVIGVVHLFVKGNKPMPFGPALAAGSVVAWVCWRWIPVEPQRLFFEPVLMGVVGGLGAVLLFGISWLLWLFRGPDPPEQPVDEKTQPEPSPPGPANPT